MGNAATAAAQLGVVATMASILREDAVGDFVLAMSIWAPVLMAANMGLRPVVASDAEGEHPFARYLRVRVVALGLAYVLTLLLGAWSADAEGRAIMALVGAAKAAESVSDLCYGLQQRHAREHDAGVSLVLRAVGGLGLAVALLLSVGTLVGACMGLAAVNLAVVLGWDLPRALALGSRQPTRAGGWPAVRRIVRLGAPLGATAVMLSLTVNVPRYFVEAELGRAELGVFGVLGYGVAAGGLVMNALCNATARDLGAAWVERDGLRFVRVLRWFLAATLAWAGASVAVTYLVGRAVLELLFGPAYSAAIDAFVWLMLAGGVAYIGFALQYTLTAARSAGVQVVAVALELLVLGLACALLVPEHGLVGGALAALAGSGVRAVVLGVSVLGVLRSLGEGTR